MKQRKNKIVFVLVMVCVVLFITVYGILTFGKDKKEGLGPDRIPMPDLDGSPVEYESKLEAIKAIKEEREPTAPELYPDHMVDDKGYFNPDYMEYEKQRIIDSIYRKSKFEGGTVAALGTEKEPEPIGQEVENRVDETMGDGRSISIQGRALVHQLFFASDPVVAMDVGEGNPLDLLAYVDGDQTIRDGHRLVLRLAGDAHINGSTVSRGTRIYGFVKLGPNRVMVDIFRLGDQEVAVKAHDLQDGQEGLYVENHIKGELVEKSVDETLGEVNLPGLPQLAGIKRIFQRNNRAIKVAVKDQYQIVLKLEL